MVYFGAIVLVAVMASALYSLYAAVRYGHFNYFGRLIKRADQPGVFWFSMVVMLLVLFLGARTMPLYLVQIL